MGQAQLGVTFGGVGESKVNEHVSGVTSYRSSPFALPTCQSAALDPVVSHVSADQVVNASLTSDVSSCSVIDVSALRMLLLTVTSWLDRQEREILAYRIEENRVLRRQLGGRRLRLTDHDRRQLAARAHRLGRKVLREIATIVTPDTLHTETIFGVNRQARFPVTA